MLLKENYMSIKKSISSVLLFISIFAASISCAASAEPGDKNDQADLKVVVAAIEQGYRKLNDLQAEFTQKSTIAALKRDEKGGGELFLKRQAGGPAMFRFDYKKPKQQIISDGKQVWFYLPENRQVMVSDLRALMSQGGVALNYLTSLGNISQDFAISFAGSGRDSKGNYLLDLVPKKGGQAFAKLHLTVPAAAVEKFRKNGEASDFFPISSSVILDQMGNRTAIEYTKIRVNKGLSAAKFIFKIPAGVEVIRP